LFFASAASRIAFAALCRTAASERDHRKGRMLTHHFIEL
jgi:hypothetical protein